MKKQWVGMAAVALLLLSGCGNSQAKKDTQASSKETASTSTSEKKTTKESKETSRLLKDDATFHEVSEGTGDQTAVITARKKVPITWQSTDWGGVTVGIDQAEVLSLSDYRDYNNNTYTGLLALHFTIDSPEQTVSVYPQQAEVTLSTGETIKGTYMIPRWDGKIAKGEKKSGWAAFGITKGTPSELTQAQLSFLGTNEAGTTPEEKTHTYMATIEWGN